jgi:hypothetical protein
MKTFAAVLTRYLFSVFFVVAALFLIPNARAGLTLEMNVIRYDQYAYYFYPNLTTNNTPPLVPFGDYYITSSETPTNGSLTLYHFDATGFNQISGSSWGYGDFDSMMRVLTNTWSIFVTNSVTTNVFRFGVTANMKSNDLPIVTISVPLNGALNVTNRPTYAWQGPTNYGGLVVYFQNDSAILPVTQTSLLSPTVLYQGLNSVTVHYDSNSATALILSVPTNNAGQAISSWVSTNHLQDYVSSQFTVGTVDLSGTSHTLVARYTWDGTNNDGSASGADTSGNGYDMNFAGSFGSQGGTNSTTDHAAGPRAIQFHDGDGGSGGYVGWNPTPSNLLSTLAGSFSISCWIKTTQNNFDWDQAPAYYGAGIISADNGGLANDLIPLALTGNTVGFNTGGDTEDVTLNSQATVNDGVYHHIVVTRYQSTGQKIIYVDGIFDSFSSGTTNLLNDPLSVTLGALSDAWTSDPNNSTFYNGYDGLLDDLQIYSGVLSSNEVLQLFSNPGITADQVITAPLVARYNFENTNDIYTAGIDSSGNGNDANCSTGNGGTNADTFSTDAAIGSYSREFKGDTAICFYQGGSTFNNISNSIYGDFSWTAQIKTTHSVNADFANAYFGSPILFFYDGGVNQLILSVTGSKAAFTTGNPNGGSDTTLHSTTTVNDGNYHFITATRNASTGVMKLYVDGALEASGVSTNGPRSITFGGEMGGGYFTNFVGLLDDVRIYGGELSAADVATLSGHAVIDFNTALETTGLTWTTSGDSSWFVQTTNTHDNVDAARSGVVTDFQISTIQTTVTGPGTISFWWQNPTFNDLDLEFDVDGNYAYDIGSGDTNWSQFGPSPIPAGQHTLSWTVFANGDNFPDDAAYLDQVSFVPDSAYGFPIITLQPLDQTNYPGYLAALLADSTNNPFPSWQWYKVGTGLIAGATNKFYAPTNSGTSTVVGNYFAVATGLGGSTTSRTAVVTFAAAPTPPDWSTAFAAQLYGNGTDFVTNYGIACLFDQGTPAVIYTANSFNGSNTFAGDTFTSAGNRFGSALLKHLSSGGAFLGRAITNAGNGNSYPQCLAPGPHDFIYNYDAGQYMSGVFFGTNKTTLGNISLQESAGGSLYLARVDLGGNFLWVRTFGGTNSQFQSYHELVSDPTGNVTISALGNNFVNFGTTNILLNGQKGILVQYDLNGNIRWIQQPSGWVQYMVYDAGRIYVAFDGNTVNYIGGVTNISDRKWALAALNATNGQALWVRGIGSRTNENSPTGNNFDTPTISVSGTNVFLIGTGWGSNAVFGASSVSWPDAGGQYFARYDTNGNAQLAIPFGGMRVAPWAAKADASGNVYVTGDFDGYAAFGNKLIGAPHYDDIQNGIFYGQMFLARFDRNGSNIWVRQAISPTGYVNVRDIALAADGVWVDGFINHSAKFGPTTVFGTITCDGSPFCTLDYHVGGFLARVPVEPYPVAADLRLEVYRSQNPSLGEIFYAFPYFNSVTPAATGTTTNVILSPTGKFHGEINASGNKPFAIDLFSFDQLLNEITNGQWTLYINKGMLNERQFHFTASVNGFTSNLLAAVKIITPTNGATGIPTNSPFIWTVGPTNFGTLDVNKQKFDGTEQASALLPITATNWPSPPIMSIGTNRFSITYTSNNFPGITFSVPTDSNSFTPTNWAAQVKLFSTAFSTFVVGAGTSSPVMIVNPGVTATSFQFSFTAPTGVTNSIQYRTNLVAGSNWQTYTNVVGNGSLQTIQIPLSIFNPAKQGFVRIGTQ